MCNGTEDEEIIFDDFEELKAVVPEGNFFKYFDGFTKESFSNYFQIICFLFLGIICQVDKDRPDIIKWKQTLNSPIVHAWRLERGQLIPINLFSNSHLPR